MKLTDPKNLDVADMNSLLRDILDCLDELDSGLHGLSYRISDLDGRIKDVDINVSAGPGRRGGIRLAAASVLADLERRHSLIPVTEDDTEYEQRCMCCVLKKNGYPALARTAPRRRRRQRGRRVMSNRRKPNSGNPRDSVEDRAQQMSDHDDRARYLEARGWQWMGAGWFTPIGPEDTFAGGQGMISASGMYSTSTAIREQFAREDPDATPGEFGRYWHGEEPADAFGRSW